MGELINNLKDKPYKELEEALRVMSKGDDNLAFIDIDGSAYMIPRRVLQLIDNLATQVEKLNKEADGL